MICTFDFNPETNEYKPIGTPEIVKDKPKKKPMCETATAEITLLDSKYMLTQAAADLLNVEPGDRINICYNNLPDNPNVKVPIIGSNTSWGNDLGNKLTKSLTVSYRGVANTVLAEYGEVFTLEPYKDGLFIMRGDKPVVVDDNVEVTETQDIEVDIEDLEDDTNYEISDVDFKFDENEL
jgi:hypothetical protein